MDFDREVDARGLNCPLPILRTKKALTGMQSGQVLKVLATDPGAVKDFQSFSRQTGHELLRDRFAGPHTTDLASAKAYTAVSFRTNTTELAEATQPGRPQSGVRSRPGVAAVGGGLMIEAGGSLLGAIGVSGAPGAREDD